MEQVDSADFDLLVTNNITFVSSNNSFASFGSNVVFYVALTMFE